MDVGWMSMLSASSAKVLTLRLRPSPRPPHREAVAATPCNLESPTFHPRRLAARPQIRTAPPRVESQAKIPPRTKPPPRILPQAARPPYHPPLSTSPASQPLLAEVDSKTRCRSCTRIGPLDRTIIQHQSRDPPRMRPTTTRSPPGCPL